MIKWHEVIKAALAGAPRSRLIEIAGSEANLAAIVAHAHERVAKFAEADKASSVFDFKWGRLLKAARAELEALEGAQ